MQSLRFLSEKVISDLGKKYFSTSTDKLFIKSDELLVEDLDGLICVDTTKYRHMLAVASVSAADNLLITITDSKKKL